jgi:hypothetical protein
MSSRCSLFVAAVVLFAANAGMSQEEKQRDLPRELKDSEINLIWKEMWKIESHGKQLPEPKIANLTEADVLRHLTGKWIEMAAEGHSELCIIKPWIQLNPDRTFLAADDPYTPKRTCRGTWRVVSNRIILFGQESGGLPNYIFMVGKKVYMLDMMNTRHMTELRRENDLAIGKLAWGLWTGEVNTEGSSSPEKVNGKRAKFLSELNPDRPETIPITVFVTAKGKVWAGPEQDFYIENAHGVFGLKKQQGSSLQWCDSLIGQQGSEKCTLDSVMDRLGSEVDVFVLNRVWWFGSKDTDMSRSLFKPPFINYKKDDPQKLQFLRFQVRGGEVQLEMKSPNELYTARVTIDLKSKTLLKAVLQKAGEPGETELSLSGKTAAPRKVEKAGAVPIAPPATLPKTVALLGKENQKKWEIESGDWAFQNDALIGSGSSQIAYQEMFSPPFTLRFNITVLEGMRPRVKFGKMRFANEGYNKTFGIYPGEKPPKLYDYKLNQEYQVTLTVGTNAVQFYVNGLLVTTAPGVKDKAELLRFCGGDNWSKGKTKYKNIILTRGDETLPATP